MFEMLDQLIADGFVKFLVCYLIFVLSYFRPAFLSGIVVNQGFSYLLGLSSVVY